MSTDSPPEIREVSWTDAQSRARLMSLRLAIFVQEQGVPRALEVDEDDPRSRHFLAMDTQGRPSGCVRLVPTGKITRLCVRRDARGHGIGSHLLRRAVHEARAAGLGRLYLNAQAEATEFYSRHGFVAEGESFMEAGILHRRMTLRGD